MDVIGTIGVIRVSESGPKITLMLVLHWCNFTEFLIYLSVSEMFLFMNPDFGLF